MVVCDEFHFWYYSHIYFSVTLGHVLRCTDISVTSHFTAYVCHVTSVAAAASNADWSSVGGVVRGAWTLWIFRSSFLFCSNSLLLVWCARHRSPFCFMAFWERKCETFVETLVKAWSKCWLLWSVTHIAPTTVLWFLRICNCERFRIMYVEHWRSVYDTSPV